MSKMRSRNIGLIRKHKVWLFLISYSMTIFISIFQLFCGDSTSFATFKSPAIVSAAASVSVIVRIFFFLVCILITMSVSKQKVFHKWELNFLNYGILSWLLWGIFITISGLSIYSLRDNYTTWFKFFIFYLTIFMSAKIVIIYDIKSEFLSVSVIFLFFTIFAAYFSHFNGLEFLGSLSNLFMKDGRYRETFGARYPNEAGQICTFFFMHMALYEESMREEKTYLKYVSPSSLGGGGLRFLYPIALLMLISSASRTAMSSLILFWLTYNILKTYANIHSGIGKFLIKFTVLIFVTIVIFFIWQILLDVFIINRGMNYDATLRLFSSSTSFFTGLGFMEGKALQEAVNQTYLDGFYLKVFFWTGIIGLILLIGTFYTFTVLYFQNVSYMTKFQKLTAGLLIVTLYYAFFESLMFGNNGVNMSNWVLFIICMNEKVSRKDILHSQQKTG